MRIGSLRKDWLGRVTVALLTVAVVSLTWRSFGGAEVALRNGSLVPSGGAGEDTRADVAAPGMATAGPDEARVPLRGMSEAPASSAPSEIVEATIPMIRGIVVDERGLPLQDVDVTAEHDVWAGSENWTHEPPRASTLATARTGEDGRFALPLPLPGLFNVRAQRADRIPTIVRRVAPEAELRLALTRGGTLEGDVLDAVERNLIPGALVRVQHGPDLDELTVVHTDSVGRFRAVGLTPGTVGVIVAPERYMGSRWQEFVVASGATTHIELLVELGRTVVGTVREDGTREVIAGARVSAWDFLGKTVTTDEQGRFRIDGVGLLRATIVADAPGFGRAEIDLDAGSPTDEPLEVELRLGRGVRHTGRIVDPDGEPIARATVVASGRANLDSVDRREWREDVAGEDGRFSIESVRPDIPITLHVRAPGFGARAFPAPSPTSSPRQDLDAAYVVAFGDLVLSPQATVAGRVVDHLGAPMAGSYVGLGRKVQSEGIDVGLRQAHADPSGRFFFAGLDAGVIVVGAVAPDSRIARRELELHEGEHLADVVLAMPAGIAMRGRVIDASTGSGLAAAHIALSRPEGLPRENLRALCDQAGEFEFTAVTAGEWELRAYPPSSSGREKLPPDFDPCRRTGVVADGTYLELALTRLEADLHGRVVNTNDVPVPLCFVARLVGGEAQQSSGALTDNAGRFTLRVPGGAPVVLAAFPTAPVEANDSLTVLDVRVGRRVLLDGGPLARVSVASDAADVALQVPDH